jgi:hypothetical protein
VKSRRWRAPTLRFKIVIQVISACSRRFADSPPIDNTSMESTSNDGNQIIPRLSSGDAALLTFSCNKLI